MTSVDKDRKRGEEKFSILKMLCVQAFCASHVYANTSKIRYAFFGEASLYADSACHSPGKQCGSFHTQSASLQKIPFAFGESCAMQRGCYIFYCLCSEARASVEASLHFFLPQSLGSSLHPFHQCIYIWSLYQ